MAESGLAVAVPKKCLRLHAKVLISPDLGVKTQVGIAQDLFDQVGANIEIILASVQKLSLPQLESLLIGNCDSSLTQEQLDLFSHRDGVGVGEVIVYFVRVTDPPADGCAAFQPGLPNFVVVHNADQWTLAHELGHILGLGHVNDDFALMTWSGTSMVLDPPPDLDQDEIRQMRSSQFLSNC